MTLAAIVTRLGVRGTATEIEARSATERSFKVHLERVHPNRATTAWDVVVHQGLGLDVPTALDTLQILASDVSAYQWAPTLKDFCTEFGWDPELPTSRAAFEGCRSSYRSMVNFLRDSGVTPDELVAAAFED